MKNLDEWVVIIIFLTIILLGGLSLSTLASIKDYQQYTECIDKGVSVPICKAICNIPEKS